MLAGSSEAVVWIFTDRKRNDNCEDLNGENVCSRRVQDAAASAWVSRRFLRKRAVQSDPGRSRPYAGKLARKLRS